MTALTLAFVCMVGLVTALILLVIGLLLLAKVKRALEEPERERETT